MRRSREWAYHHSMLVWDENQGRVERREVEAPGQTPARTELSDQDLDGDVGTTAQLRLHPSRSPDDRPARPSDRILSSSCIRSSHSSRVACRSASTSSTLRGTCPLAFCRSQIACMRCQNGSSVGTSGNGTTVTRT